MQECGADWYRMQARERRRLEAARRSGWRNSIRRDLAELEALKVELLREARAERRRAEHKKNYRNG